MLLLLSALAIAQSWNPGDTVERYDGAIRLREKVVASEFDDPDEVATLSGGSTGVIANLEAAGWVKNFPAYNLDVTPPAFSSIVTVPADVPTYRTVTWTATITATALVSAYVALQVEVPVAGDCSGSGSYVEVWREAAAALDLTVHRESGVAFVPPGCDYRAVRSGNGGTTESLLVYSYIDA